LRVFLTGATGFIGFAIARELPDAGRQVLGLTRSEAGARALTEAGAEVHRGDIEDPESLRAGVAGCDGVIHTAFDHDFTKFVENCDKDRRAIEALGAALEGSARPLVITSTTAIGTPAPGQPAVENHFDPENPNPRIASELAGRALSGRGVNVSVTRLSQIHDTRRQGLVTKVIELARNKDVSAYVGGGENCWSATHVSDAARLFRLALEKQEAGARYHATAESAIAFRIIAEAVGRSLGVPVRSIPADDATDHFGWLSAFAGRDMSASSKLTQERLGWRPTGPGLIEDIENLPQGAA